MVTIAAWSFFALGIGHIITGLILFRRPVAQVLADGFVGQFMGADARRLAFWFLIFGPLLIMGGSVAVHAAENADHALLKIIGFHTLVIGAVGALALPKSPFWAALLLSVVFIAGGYGWIV